MKKWKIVCIVLAVVVFLVLIVPAGWILGDIYLDTLHHIAKPESIYEERWDLDFPESIEEIYALDGERGFTGDGTQYSVFTVEPADDAFFADFSDAPADEAFLSNFTSGLDQLQVPQEQRPDLERAYVWKFLGDSPSPVMDGRYFDNLYLLWDADASTLYLLEVLI